MKFCQVHWDGLRATIEKYNLSHLIAKDEHAAMKNIENEFHEGETTKDNYDPLMAANFAIWSNALSVGGLYLMYQKPDGTEYCPICESELRNGPKAEWWFEQAVQEQVNRARELGLIPKPS